MLKSMYIHYKKNRSAKRILLSDKKSALYETGWLNSLIRKMPVDKDNNPIPWMNYSIINFLKERLNKTQNVFEYGSGHSTLFFANLVGNIVSVEHDEDWLNTVSPSLPTNAQLIHTKLDGTNIDYVKSINKTNQKFDIIIIDGRSRVACTREAVSALSESGCIILDDSQRDKYSESFSFLTNNGFKNLRFTGLKPGSGKINETTIFYRPENCFGI